MQHLSRRQFLASAATGILGAAATARLSGSVALAAGPEITTLRVESRIIEVNGKPAKVFGLVQPDGSHGIMPKWSGGSTCSERRGTRWRHISELP